MAGLIYGGAFDGHAVRVLGSPDAPLFVAKDICQVLGISNSREALAKLDGDEKVSVELTTSSRGGAGGFGCQRGWALHFDPPLP